MLADEIIDSALTRGAKDGLAALVAVERKVWLISEAEVLCDKDGIDSFVDQYGIVLLEVADAFDGIGAAEVARSLRSIHAMLPTCPDDLLDRANRLITSRTGYDYDAIARYVSTTA